MNSKLRPMFACFIIFTMLTSCVTDSDYNSVETETISPIITSEIVDVTLDATAFLKETEENHRVVVSDTFFLMPMDYSTVSDHTAKEFQISIKNGLDWNFSIDFTFLNDLDAFIYVVNVPVAAGKETTPKLVETHIKIEAPELETFKRATKVVISKHVQISATQEVASLKGQLKIKADVVDRFDHQ